MKILIVEDEQDLQNSIVDYLKVEGYLCEVASTYFQAEDKIISFNYDCIVLDITLPDGNGLDILEKVKINSPQTGIIIVSAKNSIQDKISGLDLGADDYLTKPFHLSELNARLRSIFRRKSFDGNNEIVFNEIRVIPEQQTVYVNNVMIELTKKEFDLLLYFIANKNRVLAKHAIVEHLWGDNSDLLDNIDFIYTHIKNLRKKLMEKGCEDYIKTVYGMGYKFSEI